MQGRRLRSLRNAKEIYGARSSHHAEGPHHRAETRAAKRITEALSEELTVNPEKLTIAFVEVARDSYASNGVLISDRELPKA